MGRVREYAPAALVLVAGLLLWEAVVFAFSIEFYLLPAPHVIVHSLRETYPLLVEAGLYTFTEAVLGYALGCGGGILAAMAAVIWRLNKLAVFTGAYINNPWTMAPIIVASWAIGRWFIDTPNMDLPVHSLSALTTAQFWWALAAQWRQLLPFALGATILSVASAAISYPLMLYFLRAYRRKYGQRAPLVPKSMTEES